MSKFNKNVYNQAHSDLPSKGEKTDKIENDEDDKQKDDTAVIITIVCVILGTISVIMVWFIPGVSTGVMEFAKNILASSLVIEVLLAIYVWLR